MGNELMFQIGIQEVKEKIDDIRKKFDDFEKTYGQNGITVKLNLQGAITEADSLIGALKNIGSAESLKPYENELGKVKQQMEQVANASKTAADANKKASETSADSVNKENIDKQRQLKLLAEVRDMYMKVAEISSATSGVSARTIKETEQQYASLLAKLSTIPPKTPIQEIAAEFSALKSSTKGFFNEIKQGSKAVDSIRLVRLALKQVNEQINSGKSSPKLEGLREQLQAINKEMHNMMKAGNYGGIQSLFAGHKGMSDGVVNMIRQVVSEMNKLGASTQSTAAITSQLTSEEQRLASAIGHSTGEMRGQSQVLSDLKSMAMQYLGVWGAQGFLRNVIEIGGQLEMQRLSIGAILGDMAKAGELFDRIKNLAVKSPFGVVELDQMTKQLSAYGFQYPELYDMTKRLADISAATGTSVDRLALALGHVRSEAALSGYTLRQFSMANIPLAKKLSEHLTEVEGKLVSIAEVRKRVRKKEIGYEDVLQVLKDLTNEGGMFYNAQEIMAESVKAKYKNLKDSMDIMYNEIAESSVGGGLKQVANLLTTLTRHWQELGAVLIAGAGYWAINRVAVMASNKVMVQSNLTMGRFSAAQLEMQATTGNLTRAQLLQAVATKKLAVADAEAAAAVLGLSRAQLQHVANTGKVSSAMNMATISTSKYTISQLRLLATMRSMNLGWLANGWLLLSNGIKAAGVAALGFMKAMWPMLAISAIVEVFMSMKRESEAFADAANYVGQSARNMMKDIDDAMKSVTKNGKPVDTESLREAVNTMKSVLEQSEFYTAEQQKQVEKAVTLSEKYDILLKQMKEMKEEAEWQTDNESLVEKILKNTGKNIRKNTVGNYNSQTGEYEYITSQSFGTPFFNNSLQENIEQVNKSNSQLQSAINLLSEYQGVMEEAIKKNNNFGLSLEGKSWQEQIRLIAESGHWDEFVASVENAGSRFEKTAANVKKASDKVVEDWESIVGDDVKAIRLTLMQEWGMTEDDLNQFAKNNERTMRWIVDSIAKSLSKLGVAEAIIDQFKQKLLELFGVAGSGKPVKKELTEYDKQTDLGKRLMRNVLNYNKNNGKGGNGVTTVKEINEITGTGENQKSVVEVTKALKERAQKSLENMKETKKIYGEASKEYKEAKKKYDHDLNLAESNGIKESEIRSGKYKDKKDKTGDEEAKRLRERVRILKEAADSYQYWREKVGDAAASAHMQDEFGQLLTEQNLQLKNADELKAKLQELRAEYSKKPQTKAMVEAIKEIDKELAQLDRKDFEKDVDKFASKVQIELDSLTRAWEVFNNVREATGNVELAIQISGVDYQNGKNRNLADALKEKIQKDFDAAGGGIAFDINLSDDDIDKKIKAAVPAASEERIKGLVEEYKKWRDLQRDVLKNDVSVFLKAREDEYDTQQQLDKVADAYRKNKQSLDNLLSEFRQGNPNGINEGEYSKALALLNSKTNWEKFKAQNNFKWTFDNLNTTSLSTLKKMVQAMREYAKTTEMNEEVTMAWHEAMDKLLDQESVLDPLKAIGDAVKIYNDAVRDRDLAEQQLRISKMSRSERIRQGIDETTVLQVEEAQQKYDKATSRMVNAFGNLQKAVTTLSARISQLGSDLSNLGSTIGGSFGDILSGFGGMLSSLGSGMDSIKNLQVGEKGLGKVLGNVSAVASVVTAMIGMNHALSKILPNTESLYEHYAEKQKKVNQLREAIDSYRVAIAKARAEEHGWMTDDALGALQDAYKIHGEIVMEYYNKLYEAQEAYVDASAGIKKAIIPIVAAVTAIAAVVAGVFTFGSGGVGVAALGGAAIGALSATAAAALSTTALAAIGTAIAAGAGYAIGQAVQAGIDSITYGNGQTDARSNMKVQTQHKTFFRGEKTQNLEEWAKENLGVNLFEEDGLINLEAAQAVLDSGATLVGETKETLEKLIELREQYDEWEKSVKDYISSSFGSLADNMVDAIWDWLADGKDALDSFRDYASDTFKKVAQDAVKSFLRIAILDEFEDKLKNLYKAYSMKDSNGNRVINETELMLGVASLAGDLATAFESILPIAQQLGETIAKAFDYQGYDIVNGSNGDSSSTGSSIKGITEQTADLLASYLNSVRADVSVIRITQFNYFEDMKRLTTSGNASLRNIENHTDAIMRSNDAIQQSNSEILAIFKRVTQGGDKVRV